LRCVRRRRESFGALPARHCGSGGVVKTRGDGVRGLKTPWKWGTEEGATASPAGFAHTNGTRRSRARETPQGPHTACLRGWETVGCPPATASVHEERKRVVAGPPTAHHRMLSMRAWVEGRRPGPYPRWPARGQKRSSVGLVRGDNATGPTPPNPRAATTRQVPPIAVSRGRRPPVGPLGLLTPRGASRRTHVYVASARVEARSGPLAPQKRRHPPDPRRETGRGLPMRCLGRRGAPAQAPPIPQCLLIGPHTMRGLTTGQWLPSSLSARATQSVDIRVCEALIAITRWDNVTIHFCATLSNLPPSATTGRHIVRLRQAASNHVHRRTEGGAQPDQIAARSRQNILKIP